MNSLQMCFIKNVQFCFCIFSFLVLNTLCSINYNMVPKGPRISKPRSTSSGVSPNVCFLKPQKGPCRAKISMFYFDPEKKQCAKFLWGGCQGNGNRFDTEKDCLSYCKPAPLPEGSVRPNFCSLTFDYGYCFGSAPRFYFDRVWSVCKETIYSGCGGNKNNFYSKEQCDAVCRFGKPSQGIRLLPSTKKVLIINPFKAPKPTQDHQMENLHPNMKRGHRKLNKTTRINKKLGFGKTTPCD